MEQSISLSKLKTSAQVRERERERVEERQRKLLVLILSHLSQSGYSTASHHLSKESNISLEKVCVADNMELMLILSEFETYYQFKNGKPPKLIRKISPSAAAPSISSTLSTQPGVPARYEQNDQIQFKSTVLSDTLRKVGSSPSRSSRQNASTCSKIKTSDNPLPPISSSSIAPTTTTSQQQPSIEAIGTKTGNDRTNQNSNNISAPAAEPAPISNKNLQEDDEYHSKLLKPLPYFATSDLRDLAHSIQSDIFTHNPNVHWSDISGLDTSKRRIKEALVFPIKYPHLFTGLLRPWKGILLYGPPGTGKTMLAKAVATECKTTFFNISAASVVSKWRGDSEKLIRVLFELARYHAPSTIFLDELESIMSHRGGGGDAGGEHEGSRRMKTELLIQMDGLAKSDDLVFLLAASNLPWDLDRAMLRRLEKRILIDVPDFAARQALFEKLIKDHLKSNDDHINYTALAKRTNGYSGADITLVCREAAMRPLRALFARLDCDTDVAGVEVDVLGMSQVDVEAAIESTKSSCEEGMRARYAEWENAFGSV